MAWLATVSSVFRFILGFVFVSYFLCVWQAYIQVTAWLMQIAEPFVSFWDFDLTPHRWFPLRKIYGVHISRSNLLYLVLKTSELQNTPLNNNNEISINRFKQTKPKKTVRPSDLPKSGSNMQLTKPFDFNFDTRTFQLHVPRQLRSTISHPIRMKVNSMHMLTQTQSSSQFSTTGFIKTHSFE